MSWRKSCAKCGGAVADDKSRTPFNMMMIPAGLFNTPFEPTMHIQYEWKVFQMGDSLPKYKVLPKAMGAPEEALSNIGVRDWPYGICCPWVRGGWDLDALGECFRGRRRRRRPRPVVKKLGYQFG